MYYILLGSNTEPRFDMAKFMPYTEDCYDFLRSASLDLILDLPIYGRIQILGEEFRPDLLSFEVYGDTQYWWILLLYNDLNSYGELVAGMSLNYPSISDLESLMFTLISDQNQLGGKSDRS